MGDIHKEIENYCIANNIVDINKFKDDLLQKAFTIEKYGLKPSVLVDRVNETVASEVIPVIALNPITPIIIPEIKEVKKEVKKDIYDE